MRKLDRRRRANFEFVREGQFQKEAEIARIRVRLSAETSFLLQSIAMYCCEPKCITHVSQMQLQEGFGCTTVMVKYSCLQGADICGTTLLLSMCNRQCSTPVRKSQHASRPKK